MTDNPASKAIIEVAMAKAREDVERGLAVHLKKLRDSLSAESDDVIEAAMAKATDDYSAMALAKLEKFKHFLMTMKDAHVPFLKGDK